ncbi:MAG: sarcosine oxidase [Mariniblastus sp.]
MSELATVYDCIVIGFGGVGSAALREAALRGWSVLGIDRFGPAHDRGSSHGKTRVIRRAYFEHPNYVPLAQRAYEKWDELTKRHRTSPTVPELLTQTGLLQIGRPDSQLIQGVLASSQQHDLAIEQFTAEEVERRLPLFKVDPEHIGLFEPGAGVLHVEQCVAALIKQALKHGASLQSNTVVDRWDVEDDGTVRVSTDKGTFSAKRLIVSAGAWNTSMLPGLKIDIRVIQKQQHWFQLDRVDQKIQNDFPCFLVEKNNGDCFYGVPDMDYLGMKICEHSGGRPLDNAESLDRALDQVALKRTEAFMKTDINFGRSRLVHHSACMYSMSADGNFVVDQHPEFSNVVFAAGLSGHGFKFASVLGEHLVRLLEGECEPELEFLRIGNRELQASGN